MKKMKKQEYPLFAFRLTQNAKDDLEKELELTCRHLEKVDRKRSWSKGEVMVESLDRGLKELRKK